MPGISFVYKSKNNSPWQEGRIEQALDYLTESKETYQKEILLSESNYTLGISKYNEYPIIALNTEEFYICLEGYIYSRDKSIPLEIDLINYAKNFFNYENINIQNLTDWLLNTDGDFVVFIKNKITNKIVILNDALGRLPLYFHQGNGEVIISRELRFIAKLMDNKKYDNMAIAQYLLFSYPLGKRTLLENVDRVEPATLIVVDEFQSEVVKIYNLNRCFNFENKKYNDKSLEENSSEIALLFEESCLNRATANPNNKNIISLSGGLDSRTVAAGFHKCKIPFSAVTFPAPKDEQIAKELAQALNIDHRILVFPPPKGEDLLKLLRYKNGLNHLGASYLLPFFHKIKEIYGVNMNHFAGGLGDKVLPDMRPKKKLSDLEDLIQFLAFKIPHMYKINIVASLMKNLKYEDIISDIKNQVLSYPEDNPNLKYVHFVMYERSFKRFFEAEDRNRCFFWSATPFSSVHLFKYAMNCPDEQKSMYKLYREVLIKLSPEAAAINYANRGVPITSFNFKASEFISEYLPIILKMNNKIQSQLNKIFKPKEIAKPREYVTNAVKTIQKQFNTCDAVSDYFSERAIGDIVENSGKYRQDQIAFLLTITSAIEDFECGKSTLEEYSEIDFK